jgi:hypothetical protein
LLVRRQLTHPATAGCALLLLLLSPVAAAFGQSVRGIGDDALTAPRGSIRVQVSTSLSDFSSRYGKNTPGRADGSREPLGIDFTTDSLGAAQFPGLASVESAIRSLTGNANFRLTLGRSVLLSSVRTQTTPIALEAGLTNRLSIGVVVPFVTARNLVSFNLPNDTTRRGNMTVNPALFDSSSAAQNTTLISQMTAARNQLQSLIASCTTNPSSSASCPSVLASGATVASNANTFTAAITQVYGDFAIAGSTFVPRGGTAADSAIRNRVSAFRTQFQGFGITALTASTAGPATATTAVTRDAVQGALADSATRVFAEPINTITRQGIGDVEVALKLKLFDSFGTRSDTSRFLPRGVNLRQSVAGVYRFGTSTIDSPDNLLDVGTGQGQADIEVRSFTDLVIGRRFFASVVARYTVQLADQQPLRITDQPEQVFPQAFRKQLVDRDLGDQLEIELTPRVILNDYFSFGAQYLFRNKAEDLFTGSFSVPTSETGLPAPLTLDASRLSQETAATEQRVGFGITFSSLAAHARGKASLPVEVQYFNSRTITGSGGAVAKVSIHQVQVRWYPRR